MKGSKTQKASRPFKYVHQVLLKAIMNRSKLQGLTSLLLVLCTHSLFGQIYEDHLGAGHQIGVTVSSSPHLNPDTSVHAISGTTLIPDLPGASRFLSQATLGVNYEEIEHVDTIGIDAWLDEQFAMPPSSFSARYDTMWAKIQSLTTNTKQFGYYGSQVFYESIFNDPDFLRQKLAFALSQIFVISRGAELRNDAHLAMDYHDILYQGSFGNYRDMLGAITYNYGMSRYLSYFQNRRGDVIGNVFPDENYAREVMQLFSIGLIQLNLDGTPKLDSDGNEIPTYNNSNIEELAKVFTGLVLNTSARLPLVMNEDIHSTGSKQILEGVLIPAGQSGLQDIEQALDALFNHPNVGPFMSLRLIQQFVKSNPSPAYVKRVAMVFNNNDEGVRGDLKAMIKAVLLDPEARDCEWIDHPTTGKLIQPMERAITLYNAFDVSSPSGEIWFTDDRTGFFRLGQHFQNSSSVFNYFSPLYNEDKYLGPQGLLSPEFQILNNITSVIYLNELENGLKGVLFKNRNKAKSDGSAMTFDPNDLPVLDFTDEIAIYQRDGLGALLDRLDILICRGQLSQRTKDIITNTITENIANVNNYSNNDMMHDVLFYIFLSPNYMIQK